MSKVVARIQKSRSAEIRVVTDTYEGRDVVDLRVWFVDPMSGQWKPSQRGVQFDVKRLDAVISGLVLARKASSTSESTEKSIA